MTLPTGEFVTKDTVDSWLSFFGNLQKLEAPDFPLAPGQELGLLDPDRFIADTSARIEAVGRELESFRERNVTGRGANLVLEYKQRLDDVYGHWIAAYRSLAGHRRPKGNHFYPSATSALEGYMVAVTDYRRFVYGSQLAIFRPETERLLRGAPHLEGAAQRYAEQLVMGLQEFLNFQTGIRSSDAVAVGKMTFRWGFVVGAGLAGLITAGAYLLFGKPRESKATCPQPVRSFGGE